MSRDGLENLTKAATGGYGSNYITGTSEEDVSANNVWIAIQCITDCVFTELVGNVSDSAGLALTAGIIIYGRFTSLTLASGSVIAYYQPIGTP